jgi:ubiquinone/menaquinone biosynthesis C-methylase UbiE
MVANILVKNFLRLRSALYLAESLPVINIQKWLADSFKTYKINKKDLKSLEVSIEELFTEDANNFSTGIYPLELLMPESPVKHSKRFAEILTDNLFVSLRKRGKQNKKFSKIASRDLMAVPEYYRRNFHHQTDGYLSSESAELYDHQVEILFKGTSHSMRRMIVPMLKRHTNFANLQILEIASGTGNASRPLAASFKEATLTCVDLSDAYLKKAQEELKTYKNINFVRAKAEDLPFKDHSFDVVVSVFMFHEVPEEVRLQILEEAKRVLKPGGIFLFMDSIQLHDNPDLDWALLDFPKNFHEPFYKNFITTPMNDVFQKAGFKVLESKNAFLSKVIAAKAIKL